MFVSGVRLTFLFVWCSSVDIVMPALRKQLIESVEFKKEVLQKVSVDFNANQVIDLKKRKYLSLIANYRKHFF